MTYQEPSHWGWEQGEPIRKAKPVPGRARPIVTAMSADQQMRLAAIAAASRYFAGEAMRTHNSEREIIPLASKLYDFIKDGP